MDVRMSIEGKGSESATKFDGLVSVTELLLESNFLVRIPSVKNMRSMEVLGLESNRITEIATGDLFGAINLLIISIGNNIIVSVAPDAFDYPTSFRVTPEAYNPTIEDGSPVQPVYGMGACCATLAWVVLRS